MIERICEKIKNCSDKLKVIFVQIKKRVTPTKEYTRSKF